MDFYINLGETTLKTQYCREHKSVKIKLKTGLGSKDSFMIEVFGIPRDCKENLLLTDYEIFTMNDDYISLKPYIPLFRRNIGERVTMIILPTSELDQKPYSDSKMNYYQYYIRRCIVNTYFCIECYPLNDAVYEKEVHVYDLSFGNHMNKNELIRALNKRVIKGKELLTK